MVFHLNQARSRQYTKDRRSPHHGRLDPDQRRRQRRISVRRPLYVRLYVRPLPQRYAHVPWRNCIASHSRGANHCADSNEQNRPIGIVQRRTICRFPHAGLHVHRTAAGFSGSHRVATRDTLLFAGRQSLGQGTAEFD